MRVYRPRARRAATFFPTTAPTTRWNTILSTEVNLPEIIDFRAKFSHAPWNLEGEKPSHSSVGLRAEPSTGAACSDVLPHERHQPLPPRGGVRPFRRKSTCLTQLTLAPHVVQILSRNTLDHIEVEVPSAGAARGDILPHELHQVEVVWVVQLLDRKVDIR